MVSPWWRHQIETFSALLAICAGNSPVPGEFPTQRPETRSFDVFFDLRLNKRLSKQWWGWWFETLSRPLWRHRNANQTQQSHLIGSPRLSAWLATLLQCLIFVVWSLDRPHFGICSLIVRIKSMYYKEYVKKLVIMDGWIIKIKYRRLYNESYSIVALLWRYNERDVVTNHRRLDRLLNRLFVQRSQKTSKLRVTGLCEGNFTGDRWISRTTPK